MSHKTDMLRVTSPVTSARRAGEMFKQHYRKQKKNWKRINVYITFLVVLVNTLRFIVIAPFCLIIAF